MIKDKITKAKIAVKVYLAEIKLIKQSIKYGYKIGKEYYGKDSRD